MKPSAHQAEAITRMLHDWRGGDTAALQQLTAAIYRELRHLAGGLMARQGGSPTIDPTALVHELYLHLPGVRHFDWKSRAHFLSVSAKMMRNILVDHARERQAQKRGGEVVFVSVEPSTEDHSIQIDVLAVHHALEEFALSYPRAARVVEMKFFGGLTTEEICEVLRSEGEETSIRGTERDWTFARAWLQDVLGPEA